MMGKGEIVSIHVAPSGAAPAAEAREVRAVPGQGLEGDRYFKGNGTYSAKKGPHREVTFIEVEAIEAVNRDYRIAFAPGETRRNVVTRGVALNHLVGKTFRAGTATFRGIRLCEPCAHLEEVTGKPVRPALIHRGGLRAQVLEEGILRPGDPVEETSG